MEVENSLNIQNVFRFSVQILSKIFLILIRIQPVIGRTVQRFSREMSIILVSFNQTSIFSKDLRRSRVISCEQTDRQTDGET